MKKDRPRLGRGLGALLPSATFEETKEMIENGYKEIDINLIDPNPNQPRKVFIDESIQELAQSIKEHGVIQPIILKKTGERYQIIAGERRFRASKLANSPFMPAIIREEEAHRAFEMAIIENVQRDDLNPIDEAASYKKLVDEFAYSHEQIASKLGKSRVYVANLIRLLDLEEEIIHALQDAKISEGHARALLMIKDGQQRVKALEKIVNEKLSVRAVEKIAQETKPAKAEKKPVDQQIKQLQSKMGEKIKLSTTINGDHNKGSVTIKYSNNEELMRLVGMLG